MHCRDAGLARDQAPPPGVTRGWPLACRVGGACRSESWASQDAPGACLCNHAMTLDSGCYMRHAWGDWQVSVALNHSERVAREVAAAKQNGCPSRAKML